MKMLTLLQAVRRNTYALFFLGCVVGALVIHMVSALPWHYSWWRTLELFWGAMTDRYFLAMALAVLIGAIPHTALGWREFVVRKNLVFGLMTFALLACMALASSKYSLLDYACLLPVGILIVASRQGSGLGESVRGLVATVPTLVVVSYVFTIFKSQLFVVATPRDDLIISAETTLFGKPLYLAVAEWASRCPGVVEFSNWIYYLFFHHMALTALFLFVIGDRAEQWRYVKAMAVCYLLGGMSYYLLPALGPVYVSPSSFSYLAEHAEFSVFIQDLLKHSTDLAEQGQLSIVETFAFVACMPSLHMAHETLMLYFVRRSKPIFVCAFAFWVGSALAVLVLGWHYLFDIFGGVLLAILVLWAVRLRAA